MIYLTMRKEPEFWSTFRKKHPGIQYDDLQNSEEGRNVRRAIRKYNIDQQYGLCAYCCKRIDVEDSLNEHIKPRGNSAYSNLTMEYSNLIASCNSEGEAATCSACKKNQYDEKFISPLDKECEDYFDFYDNGEMVSDSPRGEYTINVLNLNSYRLRQARKAQLKACQNLNDLELVKKIYLEPDEEGRLQPYVDIVKYVFRQTLM